MKLSVCIFTYNHERYIAQTIESVLAQQTTFDFEIIIGEDHSTDNTQKIVREYEERYPDKIRAIYNQKNLGLMKNHVNTILQAKGSYVSLLDGDDFLTHPSKFQKQVDFLEQNPGFVLCFHDVNILNIDGTIDERTCCGPDTPSVVTFEDVISRVSIPTLALVFNKKFLQGHPPKWFETLNAPDRPFFLLLLHHGMGYFFNECWGVYRKHPQGHWTSQSYLSQWNTHLAIFRAVNDHFNNKYHAAFQKAEAIIKLHLSIDLIRDNKKQEAIGPFLDFFRYCLESSSVKEYNYHIDSFLSFI